MNRIIKYHKTIGILLLITTLSLVNIGPIKPDNLKLIPQADKIVHFIMYFTLSFTLLFEQYLYKTYTRRGLKLLIVPFAWGGIMEITQYLFTTNRGADWFDMLANSLGISISYLLFLIFKDIKWINQLMVFPFKNRYNANFSGGTRV